MATLTAGERKSERPTAAGSLWLLQATSGVLLIAVLGLHMVAHHFVVEGGLRNFQEVVAYVANPLIFVLEVIFLIVVTTHAMLGVRAVLLDLGLSRRAQRTVSWSLTLIGVAALTYGIWLAFALQRL